MKRPYIICHMMTSLDGRIDCAMVGRLEGVKEYYTALEDLDLPTTLSGRVTAQTEMALPGYFRQKTKRLLEKKSSLKAQKQSAMK